MDPKALLQNKKVLYGVIAGAAVLVITILLVIIFNAGHNNVGANGVSGKPATRLEKDTDLLTTNGDPGKALEIQALLAREGIDVEKTDNGSKSTITLKAEHNHTYDDRDRALITIVRSGLMDKNIGLEIFDKGDFTSSKDDKKIRLARAINGELARLIKKIPPIEDASVFVSIPKDEIFTAFRQPATATIQLTMPGGDKADKLEKEKVRAIINLVMGSIPELEAKNISITDTNGYVYNSIMSAEDDRMDLLEENDQYMKKKVMSQLDRLLGTGNYVVTVSTYLREAPLETNKVIYNPKESAVSNKQQFTEGLGDSAQDKNKLTAAVSSYIPGGLPMAPDSSSKRKYSRSAVELQFGVGKTQLAETKKPGMLEEISIAVTINKGVVPAGMAIEDLKELVAKSANPKVSAKNVQIAFADQPLALPAEDRGNKAAQPESSGNPWWTVAVLLGLLLIGGLIYITNKAKGYANRQQQEIEHLYEKTEVQNNQLKEANQKTQMLHEMHEQLKNTLSATQAAGQISNQATPQISTLQKTISDIKENIEQEDDEQEIVTRLKSWIESAG